MIKIKLTKDPINSEFFINNKKLLFYNISIVEHKNEWCVRVLVSEECYYRKFGDDYHKNLTLERFKNCVSLEVIDHVIRMEREVRLDGELISIIDFDYPLVEDFITLGLWIPLEECDLEFDFSEQTDIM